MKRTLLLALCLVTLCASAEKKVLFIGNSYVSTNNLPSMIESMASSTGDKMNSSSNTPGGCTFQQHCTNQSMVMIQQGGWDVVVLQEQSQYPAFPEGQVASEVFPYAKALVDSIYANNNCPEPMFYMTWGRKNGDSYNAQFFPPIGTYEGMDSLLRDRYIRMGKDNHASVCPVGKVWNYIRHNYPKIELYSGDESHPSMVGTYAAACAFYTMIFEKDPTLVTYHNTSIDSATEMIIRDVTKLVVYDSLATWKRDQPEATFTYTNNGNGSATFSALTEGADGWEWEFGDGNVDYGEIVTHNYSEDGTYNVTLVVTKHCLTDSIVMEVVVNDTTITIDDAVEYLEMTPDGDVVVYDIYGRMVYSGIYSEMTGLPEGVYVINRRKVYIKGK